MPPLSTVINAEMPTRSRSNLLLFLFLGDILGLAMQNLENLLQMPYGCGEQNVALLASDTYVLDYLKSTKQLTEEVKSKAFFFLSNGYQKQLSFKNYDGSYSVFQQRNQKGSMWLSALTFKTLERMKEYVYVDEQVQKETLIWLSSKQNINGCFKSDGKLFNNAWEVRDEQNKVFLFPAVRNGLFCLEEALEGGITNGYIHAILAYAFALAEREKQVESLLQILDQSATKTNNVIYWERAKKPKTEASPSFIPHAPSAETEKTCYVLLALLSKKTPDLTYASKIVQWLAQQMNSHGGFSSTQDTVVALQALSKYGAATFSKREKAAVVTVKSSETFSEEFQVHDANRLLLQEVRLPEIPGEYSTTVSGSGCVYLQTSLRYNVLPKKEGKVPFTLKVDTLSQNCDGVHAHRKVQIHINISYTGERPSSNMVIVDVKMISGFIPVKSSVRKLQEKPQIQRTDMSTNHVLIYFEEVRFCDSARSGEIPGGSNTPVQILDNVLHTHTGEGGENSHRGK
uniref:Alpha-macroglobulin receptor-binding domain-containing protein n=1 Tax=Ailuropoda melanoleuca TaxID=9646 RepID=A0A7N5J9N1_AILME